MVSGLSTLFMMISALLSIGLPVVLFILWRRKYGLKAVPMLIGIAAFVMFAMVLEQIVHMIVLQPQADGTIALVTENPALYVMYAALAAGVFEETARFLSFKLIRKRYDGIGTSLAYGIGHGGVEAVLLAGFAMISSLIMSLTINSGNAAVLGDDPVILAQIDALIDTESWLFLISGLERTIAITVHISLSIFVWCAVTVNGKIWMYPAAVLMHALVNIAPAMFQAGAIESIMLVEGIIFVLAVFIAFGAYRVCKMIESDTENRPPVSKLEGTSADQAPKPE